MSLDRIACLVEQTNLERKEVNNMTYTKPQIALIGDAARVIQSTLEKDGSTVADGQSPRINPAYDLDD